MLWTRMARIMRLRGGDNGPRRVRIAIVSTPRSGNTWLRHMLNHAYRFGDDPRGEQVLYNPFEAPWDALPDRCVLMTHWNRTAPLESLLREHKFVVTTLARHPLDVLLSVLQYAPCGGSLRWLEGAEGDERPIFHASPLSEEFARYATGARAGALLDVSRQWWAAPGVHRVRYEDLVRDPARELGRLARRLATVPDADFDATVRACTFERLKNPVTARHFWQGKPGLWKSLLPAELARAIARGHRDVLATLGYRCDPDRALDTAAAARNWARLCEGGATTSAGAA